MSFRPRCCVLLVLVAIAPAAALAAYTNNILITGYWPPTNEMVRHFSTSPVQNPAGWLGENWEGRGYNIHSYFPEFPAGIGKGEGDLEVDYQDTSADWARITAEIQPVAIITFSRGGIDRSWEIEAKQRNLATWIDDFEAPFQPTPAPPDNSVPAGTIRDSTLPMRDIRDAVNAGTTLNARIDRNGFGGGFLSEFIAYHGVWYQSMHADPSDDAWSVAAGHIHVGSQVTIAQGRIATEISLRELIRYVDTIVPEPSSGLLLLAMAALGRLRLTGRGLSRSLGVRPDQDR